MRSIAKTATLIAALGAGPAMAEIPAPGDLSPHLARAATIEALRWQARPVIILGDGPEIQSQLGVLQDRAGDLSARDVVILTERPGAIALGPGLTEGFAVLLLGKDGEVKLSQSSPVTADALIELIDTMPMRQNEAADRADRSQSAGAAVEGPVEDTATGDSPGAAMPGDAPAAPEAAAPDAADDAAAAE